MLHQINTCDIKHYCPSLPRLHSCILTFFLPLLLLSLSSPQKLISVSFKCNNVHTQCTHTLKGGNNNQWLHTNKHTHTHSTKATLSLVTKSDGFCCSLAVKQLARGCVHTHSLSAGCYITVLYSRGRPVTQMDSRSTLLLLHKVGLRGGGGGGE